MSRIVIVKLIYHIDINSLTAFLRTFNAECQSIRTSALVCCSNCSCTSRMILMKLHAT
jgi:hypothetical protein